MAWRQTFVVRTDLGDDRGLLVGCCHNLDRCSWLCLIDFVYRVAVVAVPPKRRPDSMISLCLSAGDALARLTVAAFTLSWTHSIEKTLWEEDWIIKGQKLVLLESRVQGHGAGMEPEANAKFDGHWWHNRPKLAPLSSLSLARSGIVADWTICWSAGCQPLSSLLPLANTTEPVILSACTAAAQP